MSDEKVYQNDKIPGKTPPDPYMHELDAYAGKPHQITQYSTHEPNTVSTNPQVLINGQRADDRKQG